MSLFSATALQHIPTKTLLSTLLAASLSVAGCSKSPEQTTEATSGESAVETTQPADAGEVKTLRFSHFWPATATMHTEVFEPWAKKIEADSNGRLKVEIYPSAALAKPNVTYDSTAKGIIDIGSQAHGYTNGRFPLTQIAELPGLSNSAGQMSCILQKLYDDGVIASEYEDTHLLFMMGAGPGALHTVDKPIKKPADMKGMRIRQPSAIAGDIIEAAGGSPVGIPASDIYTSLQRGVIDGLSFAWSPTGSFRLNELVNTHTNIPFYSSALLVTMNKDTYNSLPDDLKKVIDDNSGKLMADKVGDMFEAEDAKVMAEAKAQGDTIIEIPDPFSDPDWKQALDKGTQKYLDDVKALGLDADTVYEKAKEASAVCKGA